MILGLLAVMNFQGCGARRAPNDAARGPYTDAQNAVDRGSYVEAGRLYDEAARLDPDALDIWILSARIQARLGKWERARVRAERALTLDDDAYEARVILGDVYLNQGNLSQAASNFRHAAEEKPERVDGWLGLARVAESSGKVSDAVVHLESAVVHNESSVLLWQRLGDLRWKLEAKKRAVEAYHRAAQLLPDDKNLQGKTLRLAIEAEAMPIARAMIRGMSSDDIEAADVSMILAMMLSKSGKTAAAHAELKHVMELDPYNGNARLMAARLAISEKKFDEALDHLSSIRPGSPRWLEALSLTGQLSMQAGKYADAVRAFADLRAARPRSKDNLLNLVRALLAAKQMPRARSELLLAIAEWPTDSQLRFHQAVVIQEMDGEDAGIEAMKAVLEVEPEHAGALNFIGFTWAEQNRNLGEAESMIRRALVREPRNGAIIDSLGWVLFRRGQLEDAEAFLRRALALEPLHGEIYFHLAVVLKARRKIDEARKAFEEAIKRTRDQSEKERFKRVFGEEVL